MVIKSNENATIKLKGNENMLQFHDHTSIIIIINKFIHRRSRLKTLKICVCMKINQS